MATISYFDNDGFLALCEPSTYEGFIGTDWTLEQIITLFNERMREGKLVVAYVGQDDAFGRFKLRETASKRPAVWEHTMPLKVEQGPVSFVTYGGLTMVAQFNDERLDTQTRDLEPLTELAPGNYTVTIRRLSKRRSNIWSKFGPLAYPLHELVVTPGRMAEPPAYFPGAKQLVPGPE